MRCLGKILVRSIILFELMSYRCGSFVRSAEASLPVIDGANLAESIIMVAKLIKSNINEAVMIKNQIQSLINEALNLEKIDLDISSELVAKYEKFYEVLGSVNGLIETVGQLESKFEEIYPDYSKEPFDERRDRMAGRILNRIQKTRDVIHGSLKTSAAVLEGLPKTKEQLSALLSSSQGAVGILQATQSGNQILATVTSQLMELNGQLATYVQAQNAFILEENGKQTMAESRKKQVLEDWSDSYIASPIKENPF